MVQISESASTLLMENLTSTSVPPEAGYRLTTVKDGYRLRLDRPSDDDRVIEQEGRVLFMIHQKLDEELDDIILDVKDGDEEHLVLEATS